MAVAVNNVTILLIAVNDITYVDALLLDALTHQERVTCHVAFIVDQPVFLKCGINKAESRIVPVLEHDNAERRLPFATGHLIDDVGCGTREIELIKIPLPLATNAEMRFIGIIEKQYGPQQRAFAHALGACKVHITVKHDCSAADVGAVYEYDSTQVFHRCCRVL